MTGLKSQAGAVSDQSLQSYFSTSSASHPWLGYHGSWLTAGLVTAADVLSSSSTDHVATLRSLCHMSREGVRGGVETQKQYSASVERSLLKVLNCIDNRETGEDTKYSQVLTEVWKMISSRILEMRPEIAARLLMHLEDAFIAEVEQLITEMLEDDVSDDNLDQRVLLDIVACDRELFTNFIRIFSSMIDSVGQKQTIIQVYQRCSRCILTKSKNPLILFPPQHQALVSLLLHHQDMKPHSGGDTADLEQLLQSKLDLNNSDHKMIYLMFHT